MKRKFYIWLLSIAVLLMGQQVMAQRNHGNRHGSKQHHQVYKKAQHSRSKGHNYSQKRYNKHYKKVSHSYARRAPRHYNHVSNNRYGHRSVYGRRIAHAPRHRRVVPWGARHHYRYNHHVYFPDYHTFYDARRGGYVYRHGGRWIFTEAMPTFLVGVNWNSARVEYMNNVPLDVYPQNYYSDYNRRYPSVAFSLNIGL